MLGLRPKDFKPGNYYQWCNKSNWKWSKPCKIVLWSNWPDEEEWVYRECYPDGKATNNKMLSPQDFEVGNYYQFRSRDWASTLASYPNWSKPFLHKKTDYISPNLELYEFRKCTSDGLEVIDLNLKCKESSKDPYSKGPEGETLGPSGLSWL